MTTSNLPPALENRRVRWEPVFLLQRGPQPRPGYAWESRVGSLRLEIDVLPHPSGTGTTLELRLVGGSEMACWRPPTLETAAWMADAVYELLDARITAG